MRTRLDSIIERVENNEPINVGKELALMGLEFARDCDQFAEDWLERERVEDDKLEGGANST